MILYFNLSFILSMSAVVFLTVQIAKAEKEAPNSKCHFKECHPDSNGVWFYNVEILLTRYYAFTAVGDCSAIKGHRPCIELYENRAKYCAVKPIYDKKKGSLDFSAYPDTMRRMGKIFPIVHYDFGNKSNDFGPVVCRMRLRNMQPVVAMPYGAVLTMPSDNNSVVFPVSAGTTSLYDPTTSTRPDFLLMSWDVKYEFKNATYYKVGWRRKINDFWEWELKTDDLNFTANIVTVYGKATIDLITPSYPERLSEEKAQIIYFRPGSPKITVLCMESVEENCRIKYRDIHHATGFEVVCEKLPQTKIPCPDFKRYRWRFYQKENDQLLGIRYADPILIIPAYSFTNEIVHRVDLEILEEDGTYQTYAAEEIGIRGNVELDKCKVDPPSGKALETLFRVKCDFEIDKEIDYWQLSYLGDNVAFIIQKEGNYADLEFFIPSIGNGRYILYTYHYSRIESKSLLRFRVTPIKEKHRMERIQSYIEDINADLKMPPIHYNSALTMAAVAFLEMRILRNLTGVHVLKVALAETFKEIGVFTPYYFAYKAKYLKHLLWFNINSTLPEDVKATESVRKVCKQMKDELTEIVTGDAYHDMMPDWWSSQDDLDACLNSTYTTEDMEQLIHEIRYVPEEIDGRFSEEDYPEYIDIKGLDKLVHNKLTNTEILRKCKTYATHDLGHYLQLPPFIPNSTTVTELYPNIIVHDPQRNMSNIVIQGGNTFVHLPDRLLQSDNDTLQLTICTENDTSYWWNPQVKILSEVAHIMIENANDEKNPIGITTLQKPINIIFRQVKRFFEYQTWNKLTRSIQINRKVAIRKTDVSTGQTPLFNHESNETAFVDDQITVIVLETASINPVSVYFKDCDVPFSFDTVIVHFRRPVMADFANKSEQVASDHIRLLVHPWIDGDSYFLIGVLPTKEMMESISKNETGVMHEPPFIFSVYSVNVFCTYWDFTTSLWQYACPGVEQKFHQEINCTCTHLSVMGSAAVFNFISVQEPDFLVDVTEQPGGYASLVIMLTVIVTFLLYCLAFLTGLRPNRYSRGSIYLLSDCHESSKNAYLVCVRTGNKYLSGTTSNITFRIHGSQASSKAHVFNYPDPEKLLLQTNSECDFLLLTEKFLGNLDELELWSYSSGSFPSWYCHSITIVDLQTDRSYYFEIKKRFEIDLKTVVTLTAKPTHELGNCWQKFVRLITFDRVIWRISADFTDDSMSFIKRLTVCYFAIINIYLMLFIMYKYFTFLHYQLYYIHFNMACLFSAMVVSTVAFLFTLGLQLLFRRSKVQLLTAISTHQNDKRFPVKATYALWGFLIAYIVIVMTILMVFGAYMRPIIDYFWLITSVLAILMLMFGLELIKNVIQNLITFLKKKKVEYLDKKQCMDITHKQMHYLKRNLGPDCLRPYLSHLYAPISAGRIRIRKMTSTSKRKIRDMFKRTIFFTLYLGLLYGIVLYFRDSESVHLVFNIYDILTGQAMKNFRFQHIHSQVDFNTYLNETFIPAVYRARWYDEYYSAEQAILLDMKNKLQGVARIRQHRMKKIMNCKGEFTHPDNRCIREYNPHTQETGNFGLMWSKNKGGSTLDKLMEVWIYNKPTIDSGYVLKDMVSGYHYDTGGYHMETGRNLNNSIINFEYQQHYRWIDEQTRTLIIDMLLYNANANLFCSVALWIEKSATGTYWKNIEIFPVRMLLRERVDFLIVLMSIYAAVVIFMIVAVTRRLIHEKKNFFRIIYYNMDIFVILFSIATIVVFFVRYFSINVYLKKLEYHNENVFLHYFLFMSMDYIFDTLGGVLVSATVVHLWNVLIFIGAFRSLVRSLEFIMFPFLFSLLHYMVFIMAIGIGFNIYYEEYDFYFTTVISSSVMLGLPRLKFLDVIYFNTDATMYLLVVIYILGCLSFHILMATVVIECYRESRMFYSNLPNGMTLHKYIREKTFFYKFLVKLRFKQKERLRGGVFYPEAYWKKNGEYFSVITKMCVHRYSKGRIVDAKNVEPMRNIALFIIKKKLQPQRRECDIRTLAKALVELRSSQFAKYHNFYREPSVQFLTRRGDQGEVIDDLVFQMQESIARDVLVNKLQRNNIPEHDNYTTLIDNAMNLAYKLEYELRILKIYLRTLSEN